MNPLLSITNLCVRVEAKQILHNVSLSLQAGTVSALMGQNGSGKSTLALTLMGHPNYHIMSGSLCINDSNITDYAPHKRAQQGLFLSFQQPPAIPGVQIFNFFKEARRALTGISCSVDEIYDELCTYMNFLNIDERFAYRNLNDNFSGGEKKKLELLQLLMFKPKVAILDEIDSGLDVDALRVVCDGLRLAQEENPALSLLIITHYQRILQHIKPTDVFVMHNGALVAQGDYHLAEQIEQKGYHAII